MEKFRELISQIQSKLSGLSATQKLLLVSVPVILTGFLVFSLLFLFQEDYTVLYTGLGPEDLNAIVTELDKMGVKYRISPDGRTIYVPESVARELRLRLASAGIPSKGIVGYEIFDKGGFGLSRFQQQVNFKRAIEGELARTIMSLKCVDYARVHIVLPEKSIFVREEEEAKASVFLKLKPNCPLTPEQVKAIRNLVAGSVENLKPQQVVVIDDRGRDLTAYLEEGEEKLKSIQLKIKREFEKELERKIQRTLESIAGYGKVRVSVSADLDFSSMKKREELYDPDLTAVVSEHKKKERVVSQEARGIPGTEANVPPARGREGGQVITERKESITNYEVSKREIYYEDDTIKIKRISVGVLIDKSVEVDPKALKELIVASAGLNPERGDRVSVLAVPFAVQPQVPPEEKEVPLRLYAVLGLVSLVILLLVLFGLYKLLKKKPAPQPVPTVIPPSVEEVKEKSSYEEFMEIAKKEPDRVALVVKRWLKES